MKASVFANRHSHNVIVDCENRPRPPNSHEEIGHRSASIGHVAMISYTLERSLKWNPSVEEFTGDAEANHLSSRAMREPWRL